MTSSELRKWKAAKRAIWDELESEFGVRGRLTPAWRRDRETAFGDDSAREGDPIEEQIADFRGFAREQVASVVKLLQASSNLRRLKPFLTEGSAVSGTISSRPVNRYKKPMRRRRAIYAFVVERSVSWIDLLGGSSPGRILPLRISWPCLSEEWNLAHPEDTLTPDLLKRHYYNARVQADVREPYQAELARKVKTSYGEALKLVNQARSAILSSETPPISVRLFELLEAERLMNAGELTKAVQLIRDCSSRWQAPPLLQDQHATWRQVVMEAPLEARLGARIIELAYEGVDGLLPLRPPSSMLRSYMRKLMRLVGWRVSLDSAELKELRIPADAFAALLTRNRGSARA